LYRWCMSLSSSIAGKIAHLYDDSMTGDFYKSKFFKFLLILLFMAGALVYLKSLRDYSRVSSDFTQDYFAVVAWRQGLSIFTPALERLASSDLRLSEVGNFHPPTQTLLHLPLAQLSYPAAFIVWSLISLVVYFVLIFLLARETKLPDIALNCFLAISLVWHPFFYCTSSGQSSILIMACIFLGWLSFKKLRSYAAGAWLAGAVLIKLFPGVFLFFILLKRDWKALCSFTLTIAVGVLLVLLVFGFEEFSLYCSQVISIQLRRFSSYLLNCSLSGISFALLSENPYVRELCNSAKLAETAALAMNICCFLYVCCKAHKLIRIGRDDFAFSLFFIAMILLSPLSWMHIFVVLLFPLCVLYQGQREKSVSVARVTILIIFVLFSMPDVYIGQYLVKTFGAEKIPVWIYLIYKLPTFAMLYLGYLLGTVQSKESQE
jgi:hypothetical protein